MKKITICIFFLLLSYNNIAQSLYGNKMSIYSLRLPEKDLYPIKKIAVMPFDVTSNQRNSNEMLSDILISTLLDETRGLAFPISNSNSARVDGLEVGLGVLAIAASVLLDSPIEDDDISSDYRSDYATITDFQKVSNPIKGVRTNIFQLIERQKLDAIIEEQKLALSGLLDESEVVEAGKLLGVDAIIFGKLSYDSDYNSERKKRTYYTEDNDGERISNIKYVDCKKRIVSANASLRIVSVESRELIGSKSSSQSHESYSCTGSVVSVQDLLYSCLKDIAFDLANYMNPHFEHVRAPIKKNQLSIF